MKHVPVSVCLTAYKRAHSIGRSIESLLGQEFADFELIITDDASPDNTEEVCRKYERLDRRVHYFRNTSNLGMPGNLNAGLRRCTASLIANLHDGDTFRSDLLRKWKTALDENPDAAFAFCQLSSDDPRIRSMNNPDLPDRIERDDLLRFMLSDRQCFASPVWGTVMGRRVAYESVGMFDERFSFYSDVWMWLRLNHGSPVMYVREPLITLTPHEPDRPYASLSWWHERIITTMYEDGIDLLYGGDPVAIGRERRRIRRIRDRRWLRNVGHALRRGALDRAAEGLAICRAEDQLRLNVVGVLGAPIVLLAKAFPAAFARAVRVFDGFVRGRWE